jgi:uncharacterized protein VirK/YbjX/predicted Zn-dependent protease
MSILPIVLDTWSRVPSLWEFVGTLIEPGELLASIVKASPFSILKCRRPTYLSRNLDETVRYACLYNHYLYLYESASAETLHAMAFDDVTLFEIALGANVYAITIQISHDPIDEGELSLLFRANGAPLYTVSFTIVPGYAVGLPDRHALLISRMQGSRAKFQEIRRATKDLSDIFPQAILLAALEGIATAMGVRHIAGIGAANQASYNAQNAEILARIYDSFYETIGVQSVNSDFYIVPVPFPKKSLALVKPGHRLRTKLKQKIKTDIAKSVCVSWQKIICASGADAAQASGEDRRVAIAEAWFLAGSPANDLHTRFSTNPADGRDWPRAIALAEKLRARFPEAAAGYQIGTTALREMHRFAEAASVSAEAMTRFPSEPWPVSEAAWVARALGDTGGAVRLAADLRQRFAGDPAGYQIGAAALRELTRFDEAAAVATEGMARFPADAWPVAEAAWAARGMGDADAAIRLAEELRRRLPDSPAGYQIGAAGLRETRRFAEAAMVAAEGMRRFPAEAWPLSAAAWIARSGGDADRAVRLAAELRFRFPDDPAGYQIGAAGLREQRRLNEASAIAAEGIARFPAEAWPVVEAAWIAGALGDAGAATRLAAELRLRFPDNPAGYQIAQSVPSAIQLER